MKGFILSSILCSIFSTPNSFAQSIGLTKTNLTPLHVLMSLENLNNRNVVKVVKDSIIKENDEATFVKINGINFSDGVIEVNVLSKLEPKAPDYARGFIGVAFRISDDNSKFECIYLRPTNGRADDQVRRNHSIQYFSFPDFKFGRLRKESPEKYESYADMGLNEWIKMKIVVKGQEAKLFLNDQKNPALIVKDLKLGTSSGSIGFWVDIGTEGYYSDLKLSKNE